MASTLLKLVSQTVKEIGTTSPPSTVIGNTATDVIQMLALLNAVGSELLREHDWNRTIKEHRFTAVYYQYTGDSTSGSASLTNMSSITGLDSNFEVSGTGIETDTFVSSSTGTTVTLNRSATATGTTTTFTFGQTKYDLPSNYDRQVDYTHYDKSNRWSLLGPATPQEWQWLKSSYISTGPRIRYRIIGNQLQIWPLQSTNNYLGFEYLSKDWVIATGNTTASKESFTVDTDTCIFPDRLMILGLKLKYFEIKGYDTTAFYRDYLRQLDFAKSHDKGSKTISLSPSQASVLVSYDNIPDTGYGS